MDPEIRRRVIAEWRGLPEPIEVPVRVVSVADLVPKFMKSLGLTERLTESQVLAAWKDIVGDFLALHSKPTRIKDGLLLVQVIQPTIRFELERNWKRQIVSKLKERFGRSAVRDVKFIL